MKKQKVPQPATSGIIAGGPPKLSEGMTLADCSKLPKIGELRAALNPAQLDILEEIWHRYKEAKSWPKRADVVRGRGATQTTLDLLDSIGGSFVYETETLGSSPSSFELTLLGSLLLHRKQDLSKLLSVYLDLLRTTFIETGLRVSITWREIQSSLGISDQQLNDLYAAARAFNFFWSVLEGDSTEGRIKLTADIDKLQDYPSGEAFLMERAQRDYFPGKFSTVDRRNSSGQKEHYIEEASLSFFYRLEELARMLVSHEKCRLATIAKLKAALVCIPTLLMLLAVAVLFTRDSGYAGIAISVVGWSGVSLFGGWKWMYPRLFRHFIKNGSRKYPALERMQRLLDASHPLAISTFGHEPDNL